MLSGGCPSLAQPPSQCRGAHAGSWGQNVAGLGEPQPLWPSLPWLFGASHGSVAWAELLRDVEVGATQTMLAWDGLNSPVPTACSNNNFLNVKLQDFTPWSGIFGCQCLFSLQFPCRPKASLKLRNLAQYALFLALTEERLRELHSVCLSC